MKYYFFIFIFIIASCTSAPKMRTDKLSILQGITSAREVEFSVLAPAGKQLRFELRSAEGEFLAPEVIRIVTRSFSPWVLHKMLFQREQQKDYNLYVYDGEKIIDQRLVGRGQASQSRLTMAVVSCIDDSYGEHFKIWSTLASKNPEYLLMIGDNVYADKDPSSGKISPAPESIWRRYTDVRLRLPFYFQQKLVPVHALWDDHDFGGNSSNETFEHKEASKEIFDAFFAQSLSSEAYSKGQGVGGLLSLGDFNLYFLDARSFRSPNPEGRHLGSGQHQWLLKSLKEESQPSFLIKGDQFFGGHHKYESFEGSHPQDFADFVSDLRKTQTPIVFVSGDRHLSEVMQFPRSLFGLPSFEITSSPMHGRVFEFDGNKNPWGVVQTNNKVNFTIINSLAQDNHWFMDIENVGENGDIYYRREVAVFIKDLQNNLNEVRKRRHGRRRSKSLRGGRR